MATNTAASFTNHTGNGTAGPFSISFSYLAESEVDVTVGGVLKTITTHYTFTSATQITFTSGNEPGNGVAIKFQRDTDISSKKVDFVDGSVLTESDLDTQNDQVLFAQQEILDKLSGIEENATADQTDAEIRTAVENATDSNVFTDADHSKLDAIEASATADQTASEIRALVESASDSNVFTDADHTKLNNIEANATADQTNAEIRTAVEAATDSNVFTDADHTKLNGIETSATADQTGAEIKSLYEGESDTNAFTDSEKTKLAGIEASATADQSNSEIKTAYEANSDTNAFTDAEKTKLSGIETSADVTDATNVDAAGAVMNSDLDGKGEILVGDGSGDPTALSVGTNGYILTADSTEATGVKWAANAGGGGGSGISNVVEDSTPQLGGNLDVQTNEITTSTTNGNVKLNPNGTGVVEVKGDGSSADGTIQLNCSQNSHGVKIKSPPHSANASYTLTLPNNDGDAGQFLKTDGSGGLSFDTVSQPDADKITEGNTEAEVVDTGSDGHFKVTTEGTERFRVAANGNVGIGSNSPSELLQVYDASGNPTINVRANNQNTASLKLENDDGDWTISSGTASYPLNFAVGGSNKLTILNDGKVGIGDTTPSTALDVNGTITGTTFAGSGASLTSLPAANLTGTLPAIDGSNLTGIGSGKILQVVSNNFTTAVSRATNDITSFADISGFSQAITPSATSSKIGILLTVNISNQYTGRNCGVRVLRDSSTILMPTGGSNTNFHLFCRGSSNVSDIYNGSVFLLDSPNTTSSITYKVQWAAEGYSGGNNTIYTNKRGYSNQDYSAASSITLWEIAA